MFIWDFAAGTVLDALLDWVYSQIVGFLGNFFAVMGSMGVELFDLDWVQSIMPAPDPMRFGRPIQRGLRAPGRAKTPPT